MDFAPDSRADDSHPPLWTRLGRALQRRLHPPVLTPLQADTVSNWPPEVGKVLGSTERLVYAQLSGAMQGVHPQGFLLAHVPLPRLVRVPSRRSYKDWLARTGHLSADFVLCDASSRPLVVVLMAAMRESPRAERRRERLLRVLQAAGVRVIEWSVGWQPEPRQLREALFSAAAPEQTHVN